MQPDDRPAVDAATRRRMQAVRRIDTEPELRLRRALWRAGLRYRLNRRVAGTRPDLVFPGAMVAVFVDGCFWHGCPRHPRPRRNAEFWHRKVMRNQARDERDARALAHAGWVVIRVWECDLNRDLESSIEQIWAAVRP